jgi:hypothetical protein
VQLNSAVGCLVQISAECQHCIVNTDQIGIIDLLRGERRMDTWTVLDGLRWYLATACFSDQLTWNWPPHSTAVEVYRCLGRTGFGIWMPMCNVRRTRGMICLFYIPYRPHFHRMLSIIANEGLMTESRKLNYYFKCHYLTSWTRVMEDLSLCLWWGKYCYIGVNYRWIIMIVTFATEEMQLLKIGFI